MNGPLILISNHAKSNEAYARERASGLIPRLDYMEIARTVGGKVVGHANGANILHELRHRVEKRLKIDLVEAWQAFRQSDHYSGILSTSEKQALPLAFFMQRMRLQGNPQPIRHVVIGHRLSTFNKNVLFNLSPVQRSFTHLICVSKAQADYAIQKLNMPADRVSFIYDKTDPQFFQPVIDCSTRFFILAVGQEQRDYNALVKAIEGSDIQLVIVASSPWSSFDIRVKEHNHVTLVNNITYQLLKSLYAQAHMVVLPLNNVNYAAGVTTLIESMAMAKPIVVSKTSGLQDYMAPGETVRTVSCGNVEELRDAIFSLWDNSHQMKELGANARTAVLENMNMDLYVDKVSQIILQTCSPVTG